MCGRGPTMDMSPLSTLMNWGSSSMLVMRRTLPTRVMRGSFFILNTGPSFSLCSIRSLSFCSASGHMVRNLYILNSLPLRPTRCWVKMGLAPGLSIQMAA